MMIQRNLTEYTFTVSVAKMCKIGREKLNHCFRADEYVWGTHNHRQAQRRCSMRELKVGQNSGAVFLETRDFETPSLLFRSIVSDLQQNSHLKCLDRLRNLELRPGT